MLNTRKYLASILLISGLLSTPVFADNQGSQFSLTLDAMGQGIFPSDWSQYALGAGGSAFLDWRPVQFLSFGVGGEYGDFFYSSIAQNISFQLYSVDLGARIFPTGTNYLGEFYLQGGVGLNLSVQPNQSHGYAGLGWRQFLGHGLALDMGAQYDYYAYPGANLNGIAGKLGLAFLFGRDDWSEPQPAFKPRPRTIVVGAVWKGPSTFKWQTEKDLRTVAFQLYGDEALYPLIVDANKDLIAREGLRPGIVLEIPPPPKTNSEIDGIEKEALTENRYIQWEQKSEGRIPQAYKPWVSSYRWKYGDDLSSVAQKLYGDDALYPLLVDANAQKLVHPANLVPGKVLIVPKLPPENLLEDARKKAWSDSNYLWWLNISKEHNSNIVAPPKY